MSNYPPPYGSKPPPYSPPQQWSSTSWNYQTPTYPYYMAGTVMMPVQVPSSTSSQQPTHVTNYITTPQPHAHTVTNYVNPPQAQVNTVNYITPEPKVNTVTHYVTSPEPQVKTVTHYVTPQEPLVETVTDLFTTLGCGVKKVTKHIISPEPRVETVTRYVTSEPSSRIVHVIESPVGVEWVSTYPANTDHLTGRAVMGGSCNGYNIWIIRAWHNGSLVPGRLIKSRPKTAAVPYNGRAVQVEEIEVLCAKPEKLRWESASLGNVPPGAIPGGVTAGGETLYIGRAKYLSNLLAGKVQPSHQRCYIVYCNQEIAMENYQVLVSR